MYTDSIFSGGTSELTIDKKIAAGIKYSRGYFDECKEQGKLRSYATTRNRQWEREFRAFSKENSSRFEDGRLNNKFYRRKLSYDVVVPYNVYAAVIDHYHHAVENNIDHDVYFMEKYMDHIMMFCQAIWFYKDKYPSFLRSRRDMTPMYVKLIYALIGREYKKIVTFLQKIKAVKVDEMYIPGYRDKKVNVKKKGICRHYAFGMELDDRFVVYQVSNKVIITKQFDVGETPFNDDIQYASDSANTVKDKQLNEWFSSRFALSQEVMDNRSDDYDGFTYYFSKVADDGAILRNFTIGRDKFGSRLYHPFLNINRKLRKYITIDGSRDTSVIDLNNSHPYFFSLLFDEKFLVRGADRVVPAYSIVG
jgi:hypothetical protein